MELICNQDAIGKILNLKTTFEKFLNEEYSTILLSSKSAISMILTHATL